MASKILTGNMPEIMEKIINNLDKDFYSLHSCALVSRHWCTISIPILWRDPFFDENSEFISIYLSSLNHNDVLNNDEKLALKECGIIIDSTDTLFDYANFLKVLDLSLLDSRVSHWTDLRVSSKRKNKHLLTFDLANLLLKIFIKSGATLTKLDLYFREDYVEISVEVFKLLGRNKQFLSRLQVLFVASISEPFMKKAILFLRILAESATKIIDLKFSTLYCDYENYQKRELYPAFVNVIKSQEKILRYNFIGDGGLFSNFYGVISAVESHKKVLKELLIDYCVNDAEFKALENCENLEVIRISRCYNEMEILKTLSTSLCKISTLEISSYGPIDTTHIIPTLKKSGLSLQRLKLDTSSEKEIQSQTLLFKTLMESCSNLTYLYISGIVLSAQFLDLISCLQKLQFLSLCWKNDGSEKVEVMKTHIINFAEILPLTLEYLDIIDTSSSSYIDTLLDNCDVPLKKLLFNLDTSNDYEEKIDSLIRFCIRKKTLNEVYVNIMTFNKFNRPDLISNYWDKIQKDLEEYVELVPYSDIFVDIV